MKRFLSLVLTVAFVMSVMLLVSCGSNVDDQTTPTSSTTAATTGGTTESTTAGTEATTEQPIIAEGYDRPDGYLDVDFGGEHFVFITTTDFGWETQDEIWVESREGGSIVNTAVYDRNAIMSKLYNCTIEAVPGVGNLIQDDITTGSSNYDFVTMQYAAFNSNSSHYYVNIYDLDLDFDLPGWNMAYIDQCSTVDSNGVKRMYGFDGDFGLTGVGAIWVMAVNLDLFETNFKDENIFEIVENHEWTIDKLTEFCASIMQDNGDQVWNVGDDVFGLVSTTHNTTGLLTGAGIKFVQKNADGKLFCDKNLTVFTGNNESAINKFTAL
ncbi:MAG: hypothetical protein MJ236_02975 [Clostridia bacterium]|nr:hypothetical protein [Clostridia bacterium]